jgi:hypothetical protein
MCLEFRRRFGKKKAPSRLQHLKYLRHHTLLFRDDEKEPGADDCVDGLNILA